MDSVAGIVSAQECYEMYQCETCPRHYLVTKYHSQSVYSRHQYKRCHIIMGKLLQLKVGKNVCNSQKSQTWFYINVQPSIKLMYGLYHVQLHHTQISIYCYGNCELNKSLIFKVTLIVIIDWLQSLCVNDLFFDWSCPHHQFQLNWSLYSVV